MKLPSRPFPTNVIIRRGTELHAGTGLDRDSVVEAENIATLSKDVISQKIGTFGSRAMQLIDQCLRLSLGLERGA